jgi:hypothetical protein
MVDKKIGLTSCDILCFPGRWKMREGRLVVTILISIGVFSGCAGTLYTVAPVPASPPAKTTKSEAGGLEVGALAYSDERSLSQFEANLPLAGLLAVELHLNNRSSSAIQLSSLRIKLVDSAGMTFKPIEPKKALKRVMKYYGVRLYGKESYARTVEAYQNIAIQLQGELAPSSQATGIVFFQTKKTEGDPTGYKLQIDGGPAAVSVQLN